MIKESLYNSIPEKSETNSESLESFEFVNLDSKYREIGEEVLSDINASEQERAFANRYLSVLSEKEPNNNETEIKEDSVHPELTEAIIAKVYEHGENTLLGEQRKRLGIDTTNEKPFSIKVLGPSNWKDINYFKTKEWWKEKTGSTSTAFMRISTDQKEKCIYIPAHTAEEIILGNNKRGAVDTLEHEYRHTQRSFRSKNNTLFRYIDEACTNGPLTYADLKAVLGMIGMSTEEKSFSLTDAYESGDEEKMNRAIDSIKSAVGALGMMLIGSMPSSDHVGKNDGIDDMPLVSFGGNEEDEQKSKQSRFFETLLSNRAKIEPEWSNILAKNLREQEPAFTDYLRYMKAFFLKKYLEYECSESPNINKLHAVIKAELKNRGVEEV